MKLDGSRESDNVEDRRGGGGGGRIGVGKGGLGIGSIAIALVASYFLGVNPMTVLGLLGGGGGEVSSQSTPAQAPPANDLQARFVSRVLASTEDVWTQVFTQGGATYKRPTLVLFRDATSTACGQGQTAMGPFYCPGDDKVYIDLDFYDTLKTQLGSPGDFAQAYVIAHEVGHHVQNLLGISAKMDEMRQRVSETQYNALSVRLELQADCFAGVWAHHAQAERQILDSGDVEEAMNAAAHIGDDALQRSAGRSVVPESFTHGSSAQRQRWFNQGLQNGTVKGCDTFSAKSI